MSPFGDTLFGGSPFIRWALSPFLLLFALAVPLLIDRWTLIRVVVVSGMELACLALLAGLWLPARVGFWAFRALTGSVCLAYGAYLLYELVLTDKPFRVLGRPGEASPRNALLGFIIIGLPCLGFTLFGRFTLGPPPPEAELDESVGEAEDDATAGRR
jgi:hypothetical protein